MENRENHQNIFRVQEFRFLESCFWFRQAGRAARFARRLYLSVRVLLQLFFALYPFPFPVPVHRSVMCRSRSTFEIVFVCVRTFAIAQNCRNSRLSLLKISRFPSIIGAVLCSPDFFMFFRDFFCHGVQSLRARKGSFHRETRGSRVFFTVSCPFFRLFSCIF